MEKLWEGLEANYILWNKGLVDDGIYNIWF